MARLRERLGWKDGLPTPISPNPWLPGTKLREEPRKPQKSHLPQPANTHGGFSPRARPMYCCTCSGP
jgi:hypothetical protein